MIKLDPELSVVLQRGVRTGLQSMRRERGWLLSFGTLFGMAILVQILLLTVLGMQAMHTLLRSRTDIRLEVQAEASDQDTREFYSAIQQLPYVADVLYITKEQAYEQTKNTDPEIITFVEEFGLDNPFRDSIGITLRSLDDYETFTTFIEKNTWSRVIDPTFLSQVTDQEERVYELIKITKATSALTFVILFITGIVLLLTTMELVRRRVLARSDEVLIERLVGASTLSILLPFSVEAAILLGGSMFISALLVACALPVLATAIPYLYSGGVLTAFHQAMVPLLAGVFPLYIILELVVTPFIALGGTWLGIRPVINSSTLTLRAN